MAKRKTERKAARGKTQTMIPTTEPSAGERLAALRVVDVAAWRVAVAAALQEYLSIPPASVALGVSATTLRAWHATDQELSKIKLVTRGRAPNAKGVDREDIEAAIKAVGGLDKAAEIVRMHPRQLERYAIRGAIPQRVWDRLGR
jgi:hypothetical protein